MSLIGTNVGDFAFITLKGQVRVTRQTLQEITRPGVDGHAYRKLGLRGEPFEMVGIRDLASGSLASLMMAELNTQVGELVTITDDYSDTYDQMMLLDVKKEFERPALKAIGGFGSPGVDAVLLGVRFTFQDTNIGTD